VTGGTTILRVLNGRLAGTEKALPEAGTVSIGHQFWQDVVIRDPATKGIAVDLTLNDGVAQLTVLEGEATLLGSTVGEGATAIVPPYVPFAIGGVALAWGEKDAGRWDEASGLAQSVPTPPALPPAAHEQAVAALDRLRDDVTAAATPRRLKVAGLALVVLLLGLFAMPIAEGLGLRKSPSERGDRALAEAGMPQLAVLPAGDGSDAVVVHGVVRNTAERDRAAAVLRDAGIDASSDLRTSAELAQASVDAARLRGVPAVARPVGLTAVELRTVPMEAGQLRRLQAAIRGDVRDLTRLAMVDNLPPPEEKPLKTVADATKKVSTVVAGDPSYIQTVDGARYFSGAMMPSGHRLVGIQGNNVVLEKNGRETRLTF
jgi:type III secretion protein D